MPNCRGVKLQILGPPTPILRNLDNFPPGAFYSNPPPLQLGTKDYYLPNFSKITNA